MQKIKSEVYLIHLQVKFLQDHYLPPPPLIHYIHDKTHHNFIMLPTIGSKGFLLPANQISTVGRELWAATSVVSIFHTYLSVFFTHIRLQSEYLSQIFTIDISSSPKKPPVTSWDPTQPLSLTQTLTTINIPRLLMIRQNSRLRDQLTKKKLRN